VDREVGDRVGVEELFEGADIEDEQYLIVKVFVITAVFQPQRLFDVDAFVEKAV